MMQAMQIKGYHDIARVVTHETEQPDQVARLAFSFIEKWGMVAGTPDGEDSSGRQKLRLGTPDEVVQRAFELSTKAFNLARATGHTVEVGNIGEESKSPEDV